MDYMAQVMEVPTSLRNRSSQLKQVKQIKWVMKEASYLPPTTNGDQPMSFVSSGIMKVEPVEEIETFDLSENVAACEMKTITRSTRLGAFEMHTRGFGSKMLSKMGFLEGHGLGKDAQGMVEPIVAVQRSKSLGLGFSNGQ